MKFAQAGLFLVVIAAAASATAADKELLNHVPSIVHSLVAESALAPTNRLTLAIGLPLRDSAGLEKFLAEVYDPKSPDYRHFLTPEEFTARFGPTKEDYEAVKNFARTNGFKIAGEHNGRLLLEVTASAADVERALHIRLKKFRHPAEPRDFFAPDSEPTVDVALPIADIQGLSDFARPKPRVKRTAEIVSRGGSSPDSSGNYFGDDFRSAYIPGTTLTGAGQQVGLLQFDGYYASDIAAYAQAAGGGRTNIVVQTISVDGYNGVPTTNGNMEVSLDIEMAMGMAPGLAKILVFEANPTTGNPNTLLAAMVTNTAVKQFSSSWGWGGGPSTTTDNYFKQLMSQGQSYFNASGDSCAFTVGAGSANGVDNVSSQNAPSSSPYITQVGATTLSTGAGAAYASESVWNWGNSIDSSYNGVGSSGGVSSYYAIPSWQTNISMTANLGSTTQRNIPDVALAGDQIYVIYGGQSPAAGTSGVGGTSCAAPLWAGFMALVNQQAASLGNPSAGFINPAIYAIGKGSNASYSYASCFHDVTSGNNFWVSSPSQYPAVAGYDLGTGWGSPSGTNLVNALAGTPLVLNVLPSTGFTASGPVGGTFAPNSENFILTNQTSGAVNWTLINTSAWLAASLSGGTLAVGGQTNVTVNLTAAANALPAGIYSAGLLFSNQSGSATTLPFNLYIGQPVIQNGGFESGNFTNWTLNGSSRNDFVSQSFSYTVASGNQTNSYTISPHSGNYDALFGQSGKLAYLSQNLPTTAGQVYLLSLWLDSPDGFTVNQFNLSWNGTAIYNQTNLPKLGWTNLVFFVTATNSSSALQIGLRDDPTFLALDDVSVTPLAPLTFSTTASGKSSFQLNWNSTSNVIYQVQYKTNLSQANWLNLGNSLTATAGTLSVTDTNGSTSPQRFYRLQASP